MKDIKEKYLWDHFYKKYKLNDIPDLSLYEYMIRETKYLNEYLAINYFGNKIDYQTLWRNIDKCAKSLKSLGVRENDVVTICMPNTPEVAYIFFAINKIGAVANMVHPMSAEEEIKDYLNKTNSVLLFAFSGLYSKIKRIIKDTKVYKVVFVSASESMPILLN